MFLIRYFSVVLFLLQPFAYGEKLKIRDFKVTLMYYSEAYLQGATLGSEKLEGEDSHFVTEKICKAIDNLDTGKKWNEDPWKDLKTFQTQLEAGNFIYKELEDIRFGDHNVHEKSLEIQKYIVDFINNRRGIVMPSGWQGHAIVLIIKPGSKANTYDLTVVNTGDGIGYHHHVADPNGIYPLLSRVWVEFKGIPEKDIFAPDAWFVKGLIALSSGDFVDNVKKAVKNGDHSLPIYYYTSFLTNFIDYLVHVDKGKDVQIPMQRSGSCTVSSVMGAMLYESRDEASFHLYRNKIGNWLVNEVIKNGGNNLDLIKVITDGYDANGRTFMKSLLTSMAHNVLKYLETGMPKEFKHAGLLGSGRSSWLYENKNAAIAALKSNKEALKLIADTIKTSNAVIKFLDLHRIRNDSTQIEVDNANLAKANVKTGTLGVGEFNMSVKTDSLHSDINEFIKGSPDRPELKIQTFQDFQDAFAVIASKLNSSKLMYRTLDTFKANDKWPDFVDKVKSGPDLLGLQENVIKIVKAFSKSTMKTSFDDVVTLLLLQKLIWKCTVAYNNNVAVATSRMCEPSFNLSELVPKTLEDIILSYYSYFLMENGVLTWCFHNIFDSSSISIFKEMMTEFKSKVRHFNGPEAYKAPHYYYVHFCCSDQEAAIKIFNHQIVLKKFEELKREDIIKSEKLWLTMDENEAKAKIVHFHARELLQPIFPHYFNLMDALSFIQAASVGRIDANKESNYWVGEWDGQKSYDNNYFVDFKKPKDLDVSPITLMNSFWDLKDPFNEFSKIPSKKDLFYRFMHSNALTEHHRLRKANYQVWLNYIKDANNARIFDSVYFQYTTDHLLNNPNNYFDSDYNYSNDRSLLNPILAEEIIVSMTKLISASLLSLDDGSGRPLTMDKRRTLVLRAANISILLTRFISQLDLQNKLHGNNCARRLAEVYKIMQPYSDLVSKYKLTSVEVSFINFAMFFMCSTPIRNSKKFMESLAFDKHTTAKTYRKTLERFHWFVANTNFFTKGALTGIIFDQFNYGMVGSPLNANETDFMKYLLKKDFVASKYADHSDMTEFKFHSDGFIVHITSSKPEAKDKKYLMINLAHGTVVSDGNSLVRTNVFINSKEFQDFFDKEDVVLASSGHAIEAAGMNIYALPDFKGISYILVHRNSAEGPSTVSIHRKWNDRWYWAKLRKNAQIFSPDSIIIGLTVQNYLKEKMAIMKNFYSSPMARHWNL